MSTLKTAAAAPKPKGPQSPSLGAIAAAIRLRKSFFITSHVQPDGDSIGSSIGLALALRKLGKEAAIFHPDPCPEKYRFLDPQGLIQVFNPDRPPRWENWEMGILVDASDAARTGKVMDGFLKAGFPRICIDHHISPILPYYTLHHTSPEAAAAACLVLRLIDLLNAPLDQAMAEALFVGLSTDTGWFRYANASSQEYCDASRLIGAGAQPEFLYNKIYEQFTLSRLRLEGKVLERMRTDLGGAFLWSSLGRDLIAASGVPLVEFDGLIDPLRTVQGVRIMALFYEVQPGVWKVSFRSRDGVDVQQIAMKLGGGGHAKAAGCTVRGDLQAVEGILRAEAARALAP